MTYCYSVIDEDGNRIETVERDFPMGNAPREFRLADGRWAIKDPGAEGTKGGVHPWTRPLLSSAAGVPLKQVEQAKALDKKVGAPEINYVPTKHGMAAAEFTTRGQRKEWNRRHGWRDNDGGYGD